ncbi:MAG: NADH-quinone oxidoreductase subunit NuoH [Thermoanaerobaculia bacterium]
MGFDLWATLLKIAFWLAVLLPVAPVMGWIERRGMALIQDRRGPNRVGPFGILQTVADAIKLLFKEEVIPAEVDRPLFVLAPMVALIPPLTTFAVIPFGPRIEVGGRTVSLIVTDVATGALLFLALASLGVYSLVLAGYSSNNKYSTLGAVRASAQMISYELALTLAVVAVLLPTGSLRLEEVVAFQQGTWFGLVPRWNLFSQAVGFLVFLVACFAETNRLPFDLPEAETELVGGYHTEYSSMKFILFLMAEYMSMATLSALAVTLYFGGWYWPGVEFTGWWPVVAAKGALILLGKMALFMLFFTWVRFTFPRFRFDQLMRLGWRVLLPLALLNLLAVAAMTVGGLL